METGNQQSSYQYKKVTTQRTQQSFNQSAKAAIVNDGQAIFQNGRVINLENREFQVPRGMVVQNQTVMCDKPNCLVCKNKPTIVDGVVNMDLQALRAAANSSAMQYQGQSYAEQTSSGQYSAGFKIEIKQAPPCPFCNKEFHLNYTAPQPREVDTKKGYTYKEAESIIEDKADPQQYQQNYAINAQNNGYYQQESNQYYSNNAYLAQTNAELEQVEGQMLNQSEEIGKEDLEHLIERVKNISQKIQDKL